MENSVEVVENAAEVSNVGLVKATAIILGVGAVVGIIFGIKKLVEKRNEAKCLSCKESEEVPESDVQ